ncbi:hypothetical protein D3C86_1356640 [compost metagenome]
MRFTRTIAVVLLALSALPAIATPISGGAIKIKRANTAKSKPAWPSFTILFDSIYEQLRKVPDINVYVEYDKAEAIYNSYLNQEVHIQGVFDSLIHFSSQDPIEPIIQLSNIAPRSPGIKVRAIMKPELRDKVAKLVPGCPLKIRGNISYFNLKPHWGIPLEGSEGEYFGDSFMGVIDATLD